MEYTDGTCDAGYVIGLVDNENLLKDQGVEIAKIIKQRYEFDELWLERRLYEEMADAFNMHDRLQLFITESPVELNELRIGSCLDPDFIEAALEYLKPGITATKEGKLSKIRSPAFIKKVWLNHYRYSHYFAYINYRKVTTSGGAPFIIYPIRKPADVELVEKLGRRTLYCNINKENYRDIASIVKEIEDGLRPLGILPISERPVTPSKYKPREKGKVGSKLLLEYEKVIDKLEEIAMSDSRSRARIQGVIGSLKIIMEYYERTGSFARMSRIYDQKVLKIISGYEAYQELLSDFDLPYNMIRSIDNRKLKEEQRAVRRKLELEINGDKTPC